MALPPVDPSAAWGNWEIAVTVGGRRVRIPHRSAADWLLVAWQGGGIRYLLELANPDDVDWMAAALLDDELDLAAATAAAHEALGLASGWKWWIAENLMLASGAAWPQVGGELLLRGLRPDALRLGELLAALYRVLTRNGEEKDVNAFDQKIVVPQSSNTEADEAMEEMAAQMFGQMMAGGAAGPTFPG